MSDTETGKVNSEATEKDRPVSSQAESDKTPLFGSEASGSTSMSFADLTKSATKGGFPSFAQVPEAFQFSGHGKKLFSSDSAGEEENPESEADIRFQPVVTLPEAVVMKSWDDEADTLFCHRCKLYRFHERQWKERGVGELKIMKHRSTGRMKLIMRRDIILKLCCNHSLTSVTEVTQMANTEKACIWFTSADYSEEDVKEEKLCAKFKNVDIAREFMDTFERCKADLSSSGDSKGNESSEAIEENSKDDKGEGDREESEEDETVEKDDGNGNERGNSDDSKVSSVPDTN